MIDRLLPQNVATAATRDDYIGVRLFPEEERSLGHAVDERRREFTTGRACARSALRRLGIAAAAIPSGDSGEPMWPAGVAGSITHCRGFRACAAALMADFVCIGIDAEVHEPLPDGVLVQITSSRERLLLERATPELRTDRLLFSAKEAVYKAWFPVTKRRLGFDDVELLIDAREGTFSARLSVRGPLVDHAEPAQLRGRWCVTDGLVLTAVAVPRQPVGTVGRW